MKKTISKNNKKIIIVGGVGITLTIVIIGLLLFFGVSAPPREASLYWVGDVLHPQTVTVTAGYDGFDNPYEIRTTWTPQWKSAIVRECKSLQCVEQAGIKHALWLTEFDAALGDKMYVNGVLYEPQAAATASATATATATPSSTTPSGTVTSTGARTPAPTETSTVDTTYGAGGGGITYRGMDIRFEDDIYYVGDIPHDSIAEAKNTIDEMIAGKEEKSILNQINTPAGWIGGLIVLVIAAYLLLPEPNKGKKKK